MIRRILADVLGAIALLLIWAGLLFWFSVLS